MDEFKKFEKPLSELAWDIIRSTDKANAFLAVAEYLQPLRIHDPERALKLGLELAPIVAAGLKEYRAAMFGWADDAPQSTKRKVVMSTLDLSKKDTKAFEALPEAYRNDDVMKFYYNDGDLFGEPRESEESVLGYWKVKFNPITNSWDEVSEN